MRRLMVMVAAGALAASGAAAGLFAGSAGAGPGPPTVAVTITKTVLGTDPGVAFPITLSCFSEGVGGDSVETTDIAIPNDGSVSQTVNLRNGEQTTIQVTLPLEPPEIAACSATEDLAAAGVPSSYTCTVSVLPESAVLYNGEDVSGPVTFAVTNTCAIESAAADTINFTG